MGVTGTGVDGSAGGAVLVTGVSGIGKEFVKICLGKGHQVFAVDRDPNALTGLPVEAVKIEADVGTDEGVKKIVGAIGSTPLKYVLFGAAFVPNQNGKGVPVMEVTRENMQELVNTTIFGKLFLVQALRENFKAGNARVFNIGAGPADVQAPLADWGPYLWMKGATKYMWESFKTEAGDVAKWGYGHPGMTDTPLLQNVNNTYDPKTFIGGFIQGAYKNDTLSPPVDPANLFYAVFTQSNDEDFVGKTWSLGEMHRTFPDVQIKETPDALK